MAEEDWTPVDSMPGLAVRIRQDPRGRKLIVGIRLESDLVTADMLRAVPLRKIEAAANSTATGPALEPPVRVPGAPPEDFSRAVAEWFQSWAARSATPCADMARQCRRPLPTVHSWIYEARLRGLLPPARPRKTSGGRA